MSAPTHQQAAAIAARGNVLVAAGAGTGKTSTVTARCLDLILREHCSIEQILMVTFTEAAAAEMRERLRKKLREAAAQAAPESAEALWLAEQNALIDRAPISTLHSFCLELVRRNFHTLGLDPQFTVLDDAQTKPLLHAVLDELFLQHYASAKPESLAVRELIRTYGRGSDEAIRRLVVQLHQHAQTLARPDAWFQAQAQLFSAPTPVSWREQLIVAVGDWAQIWGDSISEAADLCPNLAACRAALAGLPAANSTFAQAASAVAAVVRADAADWERGTKTKFRKPLEGFFAGAEFLHDLAQNDGAALVADWEPTRGAMLTLLRLSREFGTAFDQAKRELGGIDFADQEQFTLRLLQQADGAITPVAQECRARFKFVFVDECQDINAAQDAIIRAVSREGQAANRFLVGDVKQSIYRFRLADPRIFQHYQDAWSATPAEAGGQTLGLTENFRSAEGLLQFINPVFRTLMQPVIGGLCYDARAELRFGAPEVRDALAAAADPAPRVELHVLTKDEESAAALEDSDETGPATRETPDLQTAEREAGLIARRLRQLQESRQLVWDPAAKPGGFRPVQYPDMVVLLRGIAGRAEIFAKAFHQAGVPLRASRAGFFTALEVSDILNLLRLLDNPLQDLPLLAVLRSPLVGLAAAELAQLRITERRELLWVALRNYEKNASNKTTELAGKIAAFLEQYRGWRDLIRHASLTQCIETALKETHYEALLLAEPRGAERVANVRRLVELARRFDPLQREGLFRFLHFITEQEAAEVDHAPAEAAPENAVRLMTIHASKGLEFPVVALAGMGGRFNLRDLSSDILLDEDYGLCPRIFPPETRSKYPSIAHWTAAQRERRALLGEELRLLYVAMTRARDHLLLVGSASKKEEIARWQIPQAVTNQGLLKAGCYLDWLRLWFNQSISAGDWTGDDCCKAGLLSWKFWPPDAANEASAPQAEPAEAQRNATPTKAQLEHIHQTLNKTYPHEAAVKEPAKTTVTALRRRATADVETESHLIFQPPARVLPLRETETKLSAAEVGTAHHTYLQFVQIERTATELDLRNEAARLEQNGTLTVSQASALDFAALLAFWDSELGAQIRAVPPHEVNREMPFTARFQMNEVKELLQPSGGRQDANPAGQEDFLVVQGIADLVVLRKEEIWLLDFKTDHVTANELPAKVQHYEPQLKLYALALNRIYRRKVTLCALHFLSARETAYLWL